MIDEEIPVVSDGDDATSDDDSDGAGLDAPVHGRMVKRSRTSTGSRVSNLMTHRQ